MADRLWLDLERRRGVRRDAPETWTVARPSGFRATAKAGAFAAMASPAVVATLDQLLGAGGWLRPAHWGVALVAFPDRSAPWDVPHESWHLDSPATPDDPAIGRVFVVLAPLRPDGGGTLVVTGSHRLVRALAARAGRELSSPEARKRLRAEYPWFAALSSPRDPEDRVRRFLQEGAVLDGMPVRVVPMCGARGDVFFMHPSLLHAPSPNVADGPRMMVTQWIDGIGAGATPPSDTPSSPARRARRGSTGSGP
jgi:ectoine hydroxylase-related dioxygenase (phytanoyl-CoA dioxygenase family)